MYYGININRDRDQPPVSLAAVAAGAQVREVVCRCCAEPVMRILKDYPEMPVGSPGGNGG